MAVKNNFPVQDDEAIEEKSKPRATSNSWC